MSASPLELLFDDVDTPTQRVQPPPSTSTKLRALDRLAFRNEVLARARVAAPLLLVATGVATLLVAVTVWARRR